MKKLFGLFIAALMMVAVFAKWYQTGVVGQDELILSGLAAGIFGISAALF
jgi:hypothetical protein